jgi:uncharacterized protein (TIGR03067 family)
MGMDFIDEIVSTGWLGSVFGLRRVGTGVRRRNPATRRREYVMQYATMALVAMLLVTTDASSNELEGRWDLVHVEHDGQVTPAREFFYRGIFFDCRGYEYMPGGGGVSNRGRFDLGTYRFDPDQDPKELDFIARYPGRGEDTRKGIYELDGDTLRFALAEPGQPRPTKFAPGLRLEVWKRPRFDNRGQPVGGDVQVPIPSAESDQGVARSVSVEVSAEGESFRALEPIVLSLRAENRSEFVLLARGRRSVYRATTLRVYDERGALMPRTRFAAVAGEGVDSQGGPSALLPGGHITGKLVANLIYDMSKPGEYRIVVGVPLREQGDLTRQHIAHSKVLRVRVAKELTVPDSWSLIEPNPPPSKP